MMDLSNYKNALVAALVLHVAILFFLMYEKSTTRPVLVSEARNEPGQMQPKPVDQVQPINAVSVDSQEIMETVNQLKEEKIRQQRAEESRQRALAQQAEQARQQRMAEQQRLEKLKNEAAKMAIARQKQLQEQEKRLAEMKQKQLEMQKQQQLEAKKLAELAKQKADALAKQKADALAKEKADALAKEKQAEAEKAALAAKAREEWIKKQQALAAQQAAQDAANQAKMAGEVDKYKALILNAISQQWILPQNVDKSMTSQFRIRLAPNGAVLEVALIRSSGDPVLDRSAQSAIYKASLLPVPSDPTTFNLFRDISLTVRPVNARG